MPRVKGGTTTSRRHKKILKEARGYNQGRHRLFKRANESVLKARAYQYRDRRTKKRDFRRLWVQRINAAARLNGLSYGPFIHGLSVAGIELNRKVLADMAVHDPQGFTALVSVAENALAA